MDLIIDKPLMDPGDRGRLLLRYVNVSEVKRLQIYNGYI
jgi:hypothetical protein